jgi:glycosyltransferase involved in cell wall biosynthesis
VVPIQELARFYDRANLYVQPSVEEGFCIAALDAAAAGLPVIAFPAGALPEISAASGGRLVASDACDLTEAIIEFGNANNWADDARPAAAKVRAQFCWERASQELHTFYLLSASHASSTHGG